MLFIEKGQLGIQNDSLHVRLLHGVSRRRLECCCGERARQELSVAVTRVVMELAKGMRGNRGHRCEPIAILHAPRSQK